MRTNLTGQERLDMLHYSDAHHYNTRVPVLVRQPAPGEYALAGDPAAFRQINNPAFYQEPRNLPPDSIVGVSTQPTLYSSSNERSSRRHREPRTPSSEAHTEPAWSHIPPFDVEAYESTHLDAVQFLPSEVPVRLFTLRDFERSVQLFTIGVSDCANGLAAFLGYVRNSMVGYGAGQLRSARVVLTGRNAVPRNGKRAVTGTHVASERSADVASDVAAVGSVRGAESTPQVCSEDWRARKLRFSAALDTRAHWSFALYEVRAAAEAEQRRKERRWRDFAALARDATGQAAADVKDIVEAALRKLTEASGESDVATVISDLQSDLATVQDWLSTERAFAGDYAQAAALDDSSLSPGASSTIRARPASNSAPNEYARLLKEHPGARRFLRRIAERRTSIDTRFELSARED